MEREGEWKSLDLRRRLREFSLFFFPFSTASLDERCSFIVTFLTACRLFSLQTKGNLKLNEDVIDVIGMEPSFWISIALAYLEVLEDRDVSFSLLLFSGSFNPLDGYGD